MAIPTSTYRLQITSDFTLQRAAEVVEYLRELGAGAIYLSPLLQATSGSSHGYDVVDHSRVDPERGGEGGLRALAVAKGSLGLIVDIVPNHMGVEDAAQNRAWWEFLRLGRAAATSRWFDVDYDVADGKVLLPVLGDDVDPNRDLRIVAGTDDGAELRYYERRYPIAPGSLTDGDRAAEVHDRQHYQLVNYRRAGTEQNYRRFFAVTTLAGLRVEDPEVCEATHAEILRWIAEYGVTGLRVDHPDGLTDPGGYLDWLAGAAPGAWITVEKITEHGEQLPAAWPVAGMTGYDALAEVNGLLIDPAAEGTMTQIYRDHTGDERDWAQHVADGKRLVATTVLQAEVRRIARLVTGVQHAAGALTEVAIAFDVYRSYLPLGAGWLARAAHTAAGRRPWLAPAIEQLIPRLSDPADEVCARFQQLTGAVMAKGVEDTAYYRYTRLIGLNEVGADPGRFGVGLADFHTAQRQRLEYSPLGMTTLSTHDTKRGEDVRARLAVLPELAGEWAAVAGQLADLAPVPNRAFGYLLWQTFAATGLIERDRMHAYAQKAMREAADGTGWVDPDTEFEHAVHAVVDAAYDRPEVRELVTHFAGRLDPYGRSNSLAQKLVQLTMPGVPDVYQGSELTEDSLVDPDNRRPVDFTVRTELLRRMSIANPPPMDGSARAKMWLTNRALLARRDRPELFVGYRPLLADGAAQDHLIAFDRGGAITAATRLPVGLQTAGGWTDTTLTLPDGSYTDALTGNTVTGAVAIATLFEHYPVALLLREVNGAGSDG